MQYHMACMLKVLHAKVLHIYLAAFLTWRLIMPGVFVPLLCCAKLFELCQMRCTMLCCAVSSQQCLFYILLWPSMLCCALPYSARLCSAVLCYAIYAMLCYAMLCYAMLCYALLCYDIQGPVLCYAVLIHCWRPSLICELCLSLARN